MHRRLLSPKRILQNPRKDARGYEKRQGRDPVVTYRRRSIFNENGYCTITGRFKDIIIRGGENIYPVEIEERLCEHDCISRAAVVGIQNARYGEAVGAKAPVQIFWLGEKDAPAEIPQTGNGKVKEFELREVAEKTIKSRKNKDNLRVPKRAKL
ncbi:hypothetical protein V1505DRAFT_239270 [Lipomyces doorenjongii]